MATDVRELMARLNEYIHGMYRGNNKSHSTRNVEDLT
jgi:hypothetical protein